MLHIKSGLSGHTFTIMPGGIDNWGDLNNVVPYRMNRRRLLDIAAYGEISYEISPRWQFNGGIRLSTIYSPKVSTYKQKCYVMPEPRAELSYFPGKGINCMLLSRNLHKVYICYPILLWAFLLIFGYPLMDG